MPRHASHRIPYICRLGEQGHHGARGATGIRHPHTLCSTHTPAPAHPVTRLPRERGFASPPARSLGTRRAVPARCPRARPTIRSNPLPALAHGAMPRGFARRTCRRATRSADWPRLPRGLHGAARQAGAAVPRIARGLHPSKHRYTRKVTRLVGGLLRHVYIYVCVAVLEYFLVCILAPYSCLALTNCISVYQHTHIIHTIHNDVR